MGVSGLYIAVVTGEILVDTRNEAVCCWSPLRK